MPFLDDLILANTILNVRLNLVSFVSYLGV